MQFLDQRRYQDAVLHIFIQIRYKMIQILSKRCNRDSTNYGLKTLSGYYDYWIKDASPKYYDFHIKYNIKILLLLDQRNYQDITTLGSKTLSTHSLLFD